MDRDVVFPSALILLCGDPEESTAVTPSVPGLREQLFGPIWTLFVENVWDHT